jgi:hypothetical protein
MVCEGGQKLMEMHMAEDFFLKVLLVCMCVLGGETGGAHTAASHQLNYSNPLFYVGSFIHLSSPPPPPIISPKLSPNQTLHENFLLLRYTDPTLAKTAVASEWLAFSDLIQGRQMEAQVSE